ncbi:oxygen tolerance protein BatD [Lacibacter cauensis]|uniref:Oxygen tolerance protein BatD n=2 Tax=Lacibacter cauensis TaxID=510947 RepID=A0A562SJR5_9BACT|nr:oxygen tolerance protein BatD [Lacibacter cauensis]
MYTQPLYRFSCTAILLLVITVATAQVKLAVLPSKTVVQLTETFQLQFVVEGTNEVDEFIPPAFHNFEKIGGYDKTTGVTWVNGSLTEYVTYTVTLRPKTKGRLSIEPATVKASGKIVTSLGLVIFVKPAAEQAVAEERPDYYLLPNETFKEKITKNLFVKATIDKQRCYVGEPVLATFKLFTRLDSESKIVKRPSLNGFSVVDMEQPESGNFSKEMVNGKMYNCYLIRKVQLFPLQSGELTIEPVEVENLVRLIKAKVRSTKETSTWLDAVMDKMKEAEIESAGTIEERVVLKSDELKVKVLDVPEKNKPESFNGAVGTFTMETALLNNRIAANDNATLRIVIKGKGNLPMITAPVVKWPSGVDSFDARLTENLDKQHAPISGSKTFDIPFSVTQTGTFVVPAIQFSYFDEATKTYHTLKSDTLQLQVTAAVKRKTPVFEQAVLEDEGTPRWVWVASVGSIILVLMIAVLLIQAKRTKKETAVVTPLTEDNPIPEIAKTSIENFLQPAADTINSTHKKQFYTMLMQGMQDYMIDRYKLEAQAVNTLSTVSLLKQQQLMDEAEQYQQIMSTCELAVFSPVELNDDREELLHAANNLLQQIETKHSV